MPAFYAHYKFGQMVKNKLPAKYQKLLEDYQDLYEIGLHGPDILFFYHPIIRHPITQIGVVIHHETGRVFFEHALTQMHRSAAEGDKMQKALWAYALGVVCHFALDASCHTYINHFEKTRRISHHEIEKEFEKYLMKKDGLDRLIGILDRPYPQIFAGQSLLHCFMACSQFKFISQSKAFCGFHVCSSRQARQNVMSFLPECVLRVYMVRFMVFLPMRETIPDAVTAMKS